MNKIYLNNIMKLYLKEHKYGVLLTSLLTNRPINIDIKNDCFISLIINKIDYHKFDEIGNYYNLGDMLGTPFFRGSWKDIDPVKHALSYCESLDHSNKKYNKVKKHFPNSIADYYYNYINKLNINEHPNKTFIIRAVDEYISINNLQDNLSIFSDPKTIIIHIRIGDTGEIENKYIDEIHQISKSLKFDKIIVISGVHNNWHRLSVFQTNVTKVLLTFKHAIEKIGI